MQPSVLHDTTSFPVDKPPLTVTFALSRDQANTISLANGGSYTAEMKIQVLNRKKGKI
jgi:hypothetical protein